MSPLLRTIAVSSVIALAGLTGCKDRTSERADASAAKAMASSQPSTPVPASALSPGDPSLPPHGTPASPETRADAHPTTALTKDERSSAMPLEGQTDNHNSDVAAKRGDENIPRVTATIPTTPAKEKP